MASFDIKGLLQFDPARYQCLKCLGLLKAATVLEILESGKERSFFCPVCNVEYVPTESFGSYEIFDYLRYRNRAICTDDILEHCKQLALIALNLPYRTPSNPPFRSLLQALSKAKNFVHFTVSEMNLMLLGVFKLAAQRLPINGVVSRPGDLAVEDMERFAEEAPTLNIKIRNTSEPQQDLVVVDGLLAFQSRSGVSLPEWREPRQEDGVVQIISDLEEVINVHNESFSPLWASLSGLQDSIVMEREPLSMLITQKGT